MFIQVMQEGLRNASSIVGAILRVKLHGSPTDHTVRIQVVEPNWHEVLRRSAWEERVGLVKGGFR